tara:strand:- start:257 stop:553 length:297 start_codon:yes stop_codon:yes gene_type:complete
MRSRKSPIKWEKANFKWNSNSFTWDDVALIRRAAGEDWNTWEQKEKKKLVKLILKVYGKTITESKQKEIKQYKIKAKDIKIAVKEVLGIKIIAENVSI